MIKKWSDLWYYNLNEATKQIDCESPDLKCTTSLAEFAAQKAPRAEESLGVCIGGRGRGRVVLFWPSICFLWRNAYSDLLPIFCFLPMPTACRSSWVRDQTQATAVAWAATVTVKTLAEFSGKTQCKFFFFLKKKHFIGCPTKSPGKYIYNDEVLASNLGVYNMQFEKKQFFFTDLDAKAWMGFPFILLF